MVHCRKYVEEVFSIIEKKAFAGFETEEKEQLNKLLTRIYKNINEMKGEDFDVEK